MTYEDLPGIKRFICNVVFVIFVS